MHRPLILVDEATVAPGTLKYVCDNAARFVGVVHLHAGSMILKMTAIPPYVTYITGPTCGQLAHVAVDGSAIDPSSW